jgi:restriction system protein
MAKRRGFLEEILRQNAQAAKQRERQAQSAHREAVAAAKRAEQAQRAADRMAAQQERASAAEAKALEKEMARLHAEARVAQAAEQNAVLADSYEQIDTLLGATLEVDDYFDLNELRSHVAHPPFSRPDLEWPTPKLPSVQPPPEPMYAPPEGAPKGLSGLFAKKRYAEAEAQARAQFDQEHQAWEAAAAMVPDLQVAQDREWDHAEQQRVARLEAARADYERECQQREAEISAANLQLDELISGLQYGVEEAIQQYVSIVLSNSAYPECFPVDHEFTFDSSLRELTVTVLIPPPQAIPNVKEYRYVKARDEITSTTLAAKEQKDRYASAVAQVALRTMHEVFEADRAGRVESISLQVATEALDVATGTVKRTVLCAVATDRATFTAIDLRNVVPAATLQHLNALVSKSPFDLVGIDTSVGVRGR